MLVRSVGGPMEDTSVDDNQDLTAEAGLQVPGAADVIIAEPATEGTALKPPSGQPGNA